MPRGRDRKADKTQSRHHRGQREDLLVMPETDPPGLTAPISELARSDELVGQETAILGSDHGLGHFEGQVAQPEIAEARQKGDGKGDATRAHGGLSS